MNHKKHKPQCKFLLQNHLNNSKWRRRRSRRRRRLQPLIKGESGK
jgi:hypothetical protein